MQIATPRQALPPVAPSKRWRWIALAGVVAVCAVGAVVLWTTQRTPEEHRELIQASRRQNDVDGAWRRLQAGRQEFPGDADLAALEQEMKADAVRGVRAALASGRLDEASQQVTALLRSLPHDADVQALQTEISDARQKQILHGAEALYRKKQSDELVQKALAAEQAGDWDTAAANLEAAVRLGVDDKLPGQLKRVQLESCNRKLQKAEASADWRAAAEWAKKAEEYGGNPDRTKAAERRLQLQEQLKAAQAAEEKQEWDAAVRALEQAGQLSPDDAALAARLQRARGNAARSSSFETAMAAGQKALQAQNWAGARDHFAEALKQKQESAEAKARFHEAGAWVKLTAAETARDGKLWTRTLAEAREAEQLAASVQAPVLKSRIQTVLAAATAELGRIAQQEQAARADVEKGQVSRAVEAYQTLVTACPERRAEFELVLRELRAQSLLQAGRWDDARQAFRELAAATADAGQQARLRAKIQEVDAAELLERADRQVTAGEWEQAERALADALKALPASAQELRGRVDARTQDLAGRKARAAKLEAQAQAAYAAKDWTAAREAYTELAALHSGKRAACAPLLAELDGKLREEQARETKRQEVRKHVIAAEQKLASGDHTGAVEAAKAALAILPDDAQAKLIVSKAQFAKAFSEETAGNFALYRTHIGQLVLNSQFQEAQTVLRNCLAQQVKLSKVLAENPGVFLPEEVAEMRTFTGEAQMMANTLAPLAVAGGVMDAAQAKLRAGLAAAAKLPGGGGVAKDELARAASVLTGSLREAADAFVGRNYFGAQTAAQTVSQKAPAVALDALAKAADWAARQGQAAGTKGQMVEAALFSAAAKVLEGLSRQ